MEQGRLWVGAEVRCVGSGLPGLVTGAEGEVEQLPGGHSTASLTSGPVPRGALLISAGGRLWPIEATDLELISPPHPQRGEPDGSLADWLLRSLAPFRWVEGALAVASFVPASFPAIARVLHPWGDGDAAVPWREMARRAGIASVVELVATRIGGELPPVAGVQPPQQGHLHRVTATALVEVLADHTSTPDDVMAAVWVGWGAFPRARFTGAAEIATEARGHLLLRGPLSGLREPVTPKPFDDLPAGIWWPADRSWVVSTEIDYEWTFVAGTEALVEAVLAHPDLEAFRTTPQAPANRLDGDLPS